MTASPAPGMRIRSWLWDYLVILAWLVLLFLVGGVPVLAGWFDPSAIWENRILYDVTITALTVVPLWLYLTFTEAGSAHGTLGKRRAGLAVSARSQTISFGKVAVRNLVKVLPWQLGHMGAARLATEVETSPLAVTFTTLSLISLAAVAGPPLLGRRGIHDMVAGTDVVTADSPNTG
jgi:uncharacterized RDD family membrane protein YckC